MLGFHSLLISKLQHVESQEMFSWWSSSRILLIKEELLEIGILFAQIKTRNICGLEGREPRSKWDVNSRIDRALHTMQRPALMRLLYFRQPNVIRNAAVGQELVPKSGIDGGYRCSISPYLRPIGSTIHSSVSFRAFGWGWKNSIMLGRTKYLYLCLRLWSEGFHRFSWVMLHFSGCGPYDICHLCIRW